MFLIRNKIRPAEELLPGKIFVPASHSAVVDAAICRKISFSLLICFAAVQLSAQTRASSQDTDIRLLTHYSQEELDEIETTDALKFNTIVYYYTKSYIVEKIASINATSIDTAAIDVSKFEHLRKEHERAVMTFEKDGFRLILLSLDELKYRLPTQAPGK